MKKIPLSRQMNHRVFLLTVLLIIITSYCYQSVLQNDFINYDDYEYVLENSMVNKGMTVDGVKWAFVSFHMSNWHPFTWLSHMIDCYFWGLNPAKHHAVNVIIHIFNTLMLFFIIFKISHRTAISFFIAAFFSVHPMHVESVAWIAERKDVLSTFFMMVSIWFYFYYAYSSKRKAYWLSLIFFASGLMSKPMIVTLPFVFMLLDYWPLRRIIAHTDDNRPGYLQVLHSLLSVIIEKIPFFILSGISVFITVLAQYHGGAIVTTSAFPLKYRLLNAFISYKAYLDKFLWPINLALPYPFKATVSETDFAIALSVLFSLTIIALIYIKKRPYLAIGWLWFIGTMLPVIGIIQVGAQSMADRYTYIPYIGLFIALVFFLYDLPVNEFITKKIISSFLILVLAVFAMLTNKHVSNVWKNSETLFTHSLQVTENNYIAHNNLGNALIAKKGVPDENAAYHFLEALRINPSFGIAHVNIGLYWSSKNEIEKAIQSYLKAIQVDNDNVAAYCNLANIYFRQGRLNEAMKYYFEAVRYKPEYIEALNGIGAVYARYNDMDNAILFFQKALRISPGYSNASKNLEAVLKTKKIDAD